MTGTLALIGGVLAASLMGSLHCAGMCGGLVLFAVGGDGSLERRGALHLAYHGARAVAYTAVGVAAGALGAAADLSGAFGGELRVSAVLAGVTIATLGVMALATGGGARAVRLRLPAPVQRGLEAAHRWAFTLRPVHRAAAVGAMTPLLPCGWLYAFALVAAGTGGPALGGLVMAAFWLGTVPVLAGLGVGLAKLSGPLRARLPLVTSVLVIGFGVLTAFQRVGLPAGAVASIDLGGGDAAERLDAASSLAHEGLPCCPLGAAAP